MMRKLLFCALAVSLAILANGAEGTTPKTTKKSAAKKSTAKSSPRSTTASRPPAKGAPAARTTTSASRSKAGAKTSASKTGKKTAKTTTWRNRQVAPTPERYKEIQDALVAKGYLRPEDAGGGWNQTSADALKRFQGEQNIEATGKINSLSLIALGLGPKHDAASVKQPDQGPQQDR